MRIRSVHARTLSPLALIVVSACAWGAADGAQPDAAGEGVRAAADVPDLTVRPCLLQGVGRYRPLRDPGGVGGPRRADGAPNADPLRRDPGDWSGAAPGGADVPNGRAE